MSTNQPNPTPGVNGNGPSSSPAHTRDVTMSSSQPHPDADAANSAQLFNARREEETSRRDRSLAEFLVMLDGYKPLVGCGVGGGAEDRFPRM